ncbi:hypothetical protein CALVIDRAFT_600387 [Calocera viscosa TUFC12733]|uniref:Shieldin complex subunit 2 first OB fold domain-containing protein n=1 Tax=Calocera viscosa (strain TUFC12733) TaxID=1330018 RepID=A0A167JUD6_CALVF|nr:hypothetical protein CALVIDRAFT_600387 [Calocera viscosa TUFC12733]
MPTILLLGAPDRGSFSALPIPQPTPTAAGYTWHRLPLPSGDEESLLPPASYLAAHTRLSQLTDLYRGAIFSIPDTGQGGEGEENGESVELVLGSRSREDTSRDTSDVSRALSGWETTHRSLSVSGLQPTPAQHTLSRSLLTDSSLASNTSSRSIARLPTYHLNPHLLTPLTLLPSLASSPHAPPRITILAGVLEVRGPEQIRLKQGREAGREMGMLRLVVGDEGRVCGVTAWRGCASWGEGERAVRRGDVVLLSNLTVQRNAPNSPIALTASPFHASTLTVCYRTLPLEPADRAYRPDLRLAQGDRGMEMVRKVARWVEGMAGIGG